MSVYIGNSYLAPDNKITKDFNNKSFAILPPGYKRVAKVSTDVAKAIRPLLKLDYGWLTPIIETLDDGTQLNYIARIEPHYHALDGSQGLPLGAHKGVSVFLSVDNIQTKPDNDIPSSPKTDLLAKNDEKKSTFIEKLDNFLDEMLG